MGLWGKLRSRWRVLVGTGDYQVGNIDAYLKRQRIKDGLKEIGAVLLIPVGIVVLALVWGFLFPDKRYEALQAEVQELRFRLDGTQTALGDLQSRIADFGDGYTDWRDVVPEVEAAADDLEAELDSVASELDDVESQLEDPDEDY
jgi:hypothetical protein